MKKCKTCKWFTWACPGWMCMNPKHPDFDANSDYPLTVTENDSCELHEEKEVDNTLENIVNPLLLGNIDRNEVEKVAKTPPKYKVGEIVDLATWGGSKYDFKVVDVKVTYHNRLYKYVWGYKLYKQGESTGFYSTYIPEEYLRKKIDK